MFTRFNQLAIELPQPDYADANAAAAVQELLGGKFGEMSTLNNYLYQSFNFREKRKLKPFYDLVSSITAEELGHVELVSNTINLMIEGTTFPAEPDLTPMQNAKDKRSSYHFIDSAQASLPGDSMGNPWTGKYVFTSGNLVADLLHNFFLEIGARTHKMRVYEMTNHPTARRMIGYLLVRGGVHINAYGKALEIATGVDLTKMLPVPNLDNSVFDEARPFEEQGLDRILYTFSERDYRDIDKIWKGSHPETGEPLEVVIGPPEGAEMPDFPEIPEEFAPGITREDYEKIRKRLEEKAGM
ncbi:manganese catalase family protein [Salsuginibacillus kocurii]|uniref:manganese catalase family protein n=1 Tax=Salsuginibacillus kocurii TaxID=427078 RepID=UPI000376EF25